MLAFIIGTCKLNQIEQHAYLIGRLTAIAQKAISRRASNSYGHGILGSEVPLTLGQVQVRLNIRCLTGKDTHLQVIMTYRLLVIDVQNTIVNGIAAAERQPIIAKRLKIQWSSLPRCSTQARAAEAPVFLFYMTAHPVTVWRKVQKVGKAQTACILLGVTL